MKKAISLAEFDISCYICYTLASIATKSARAFNFIYRKEK
jgi:hypothetical protein